MNWPLRRQLSLFSYNLEANIYLENFLIFTVVAIAFIRVYLKLTHYWQLGSGQIHIAHMLWGGLLMVVALVLTLAFLNKEARILASIIGGLGFGTFIDELGKFITRDNNYFYQPAIAIIHVVVILFFFAFRILQRKIQLDERDYALNALELFKEAVFQDFDEAEKQKALNYLQNSNRKDPLILTLDRLLQVTQTIPVGKRDLLAQIKYYVRMWYIKIVKTRIFANTMITFFVVSSLFQFSKALLEMRLDIGTFWDWGAVVSTLIAGLLIIIGVGYFQRKKRLQAYEKFKQSVLVNILLTQFFTFYRQQLSAFTWILFYVLIYGALQYMLEQERNRIRFVNLRKN